MVIELSGLDTPQRLKLPEPRTAGAYEGPLHHAADAHVAAISVVMRHAFAVGKKAARRQAGDPTEAVVGAMTRTLNTTLAPALLRVLVAGGRAAEETLVVVAEEHKFASIQVDLTEHLVIKALAMSLLINDDDLSSKGREAKPHVTLKWGLHDGDPAAVRELLSSQPPIRMRFGKTSHFVSEELDVVKVEVDSLDLRRIHKLLCASLEHTATHAEYTPHMTLAYVKPGLGAKYDGLMDFDGVELEASEVIFSDQEDVRSVVHLTGRPEPPHPADILATAGFNPEESRVAARKPLTMRFDARNAEAQKWAKKHAGELITDITETTRKRIRNIVAEFGDLNESIDKIETAIGDEDRAEVIARTETMRAVHEGQRQLWDQAVDKGLLPEDYKRTWITTPDDRLCPVCEPLDGEVASAEGLYADIFDGPPAHPNCRCTEGIAG